MFVIPEPLRQIAMFCWEMYLFSLYCKECVIIILVLQLRAFLWYRKLLPTEIAYAIYFEALYQYKDLLILISK